MQIAKIYLAGPMTGIPEFNAPVFHAEAARLRALGYVVENPAEVKLPEGATWADYMCADIPLLLKCDTVALLPGAIYSRGARTEANLAAQLGMHLVPSKTITAPMRGAA